MHTPQLGEVSPEDVPDDAILAVADVLRGSASGLLAVSDSGYQVRVGPAAARVCAVECVRVRVLCVCALRACAACEVWCYAPPLPAPLVPFAKGCPLPSCPHSLPFFLV
jgi:hypothetical protein